MACLFDNEAFLKNLGQDGDHSYLRYAAVLDSMIVNEVDVERIKVVELLRDACRLSCYTEGEPYGAFFVPAGATHSCQMTAEQYSLLGGVVDQISENKLRARIGDLLWVCGKKLKGKGDIKYALLAVEAYSELPLDEKNWFRDGLDKAWHRALVLAKSLGKIASQHYKKMCVRLRDGLSDAAKTGDPEDLLRWAIPSLLEELKLDDVVRPNVVAQSLETLVQDCKKNNSGVLSISTHSHSAALWWRRARDESGFARMEAACAESYVDEADRECQQECVQWLRAAHFYHAALITFQGIPRQERITFCSEDRLARIESKYESACVKGQAKMKYARSKSIDVTNVVNWAEGSIRGKDVDKALHVFVSLYSLKEEDAKNLALKFLNASVINAIFAKSIMAHGRIVAHVPACSSADTVESEARVWMESVQRASYLIQVACHVALRPAYKILRDEHLLTVEDFKKLVDVAPLIPCDHKILFSEAMRLGYEGSFTAATYILAPEIENVIRQQLKLLGCDTTTIDVQTKLPNEVGLSTLIKDFGDKIESMFSPDFLFELKALFSDHAGPNVRNEIAHGLKNDDNFNGDVDFYVWWFGLRLLFLRLKGRTSDEEEIVSNE